MAAAISVAILRVAGTFVEVDPQAFMDLMVGFKEERPLIVHGVVGSIKRKHAYVTNIRGVTFYCESEDPLPISVDVEARRVHVVKV